MLIPRKSVQYIFFEMLPTFVIGIVVFVSILLMFQMLRYTEFVLIHGVSISIILELLGYVSISFLPFLFPMSLLFAILMTYGRLSNDSEIIAMKACGIGMVEITFPAVIISTLVFILSLQTAFRIAPWGNRQFEIMIDKLSETKASAVLREGTFAEGFFDMVIYANQVDTKKGLLDKVFIYDEKGDAPVTIIAKKGQLIQDPTGYNQSIQIRLFDGDIHKKSENHTKVKFDTFDVKLSTQTREEIRNKTVQSMTLEEVSENLNYGKLSPEDRLKLTIEYNKRWAVGFACFIFGMLGVGLGVNNTRRSGKSSGVLLSLAVIMSYWIAYVSLESAARNNSINPTLSVWTADIIFSFVALYFLRKNWN